MSGVDRLRRTLTSLRGLAVGDALGAQFFAAGRYPLLRKRTVPSGRWNWTDDTEMACSLVLILALHGRVHQDALVRAFAEHHDEARGYGRAVSRLLRRVGEGGDWRELAAKDFDGRGSWGNGAAMRVAPLGAWFADDPEQATHQAELSAHTTHRHREAVAGAMAVAAAAALVARATEPPEPEELLESVISLLPRGAVKAGVCHARDMLDSRDLKTVAAVLGCGRRTSAQDTVPFTLWAAARNLGRYDQALWTTAQAGGDIDTTCAIVGGVVAAGGASAPADWQHRTEPLPEWLLGDVESVDTPPRGPS